jgi:hypothetical protein
MPTQVVNLVRVLRQLRTALGAELNVGVVLFTAISSAMEGGLGLRFEPLVYLN